MCCTLSLVAESMPVWERSSGAGKALRACLTAMSGGPVGDLPQPGHLLEEGVDLVPIRVAVGRHSNKRLTALALSRCQRSEFDAGIFFAVAVFVAACWSRSAFAATARRISDA